MKKSFCVFSLIFLFIFSLALSTQAQTRRRWSPQARGTVIGAGVGGAAGAIINKRNRVVGGVIGGVVGGAAGYAIGKNKDTKNKLAAARAEQAREVARRKAAEADAEAARQDAIAARQEAAQRRDLTQRDAVARAEAGPNAAVTQRAMLGAAAPALVYGLRNDPMPSTSTAYLLNPSYGDPTSPYGLSEYRRKSW